MVHIHVSSSEYMQIERNIHVRTARDFGLRSNIHDDT